MSAGASEEVHRFERPVSPRVFAPDAIVVGTTVLGWTLALVFGRELLDLAQASGSYGQILATTSIPLAVLLPVVALWLLMIRRRRRYAVAELAGDHITFRRSALFERYPACDVVERWATPQGLRVRVVGRSRWDDLVDPLVIPAPNDDEVARAVALLDAVDPSVSDPGSWFGRVGRGEIGLEQAYALLLLALVAVPTIISAQAGSITILHLVLYAGLILPGAAGVYDHALLPRLRRLHIGRTGLLVIASRVPWPELRGVAVEEGLLAIEAEGERRWLFDLGAELPAAREALASALRDAGSEVELAERLPPWAEGRRRRIVRYAVLLVVGLVAGVALAAWMG